jgi:anaerobic magnesium-protoporphyrin IX monomethyl ester cyclase
VWHRWAKEFVDELHRHDLPGRVIWKINCRADAVDPALFISMKDAGLFLVYMGLESGSEEGLQTLHKLITAEQNLRAVQILKDIDLHFEFGFMLFDPSTTFSSVQENLSFLRAIVGDGSTAAAFCRMIPYDGTPIKDELLRAGRLRGDIRHPDYTFLDSRVSAYYEELSHIVDVTGWIHGIESLSPQLNYAWIELAAMERLFPSLPGLNRYREVVREITAASNELLFRVVEDTATVYTDGLPQQWSTDVLRQQCASFLARLVAERNAFVRRNQEIFLASLTRELAAYSVSG